MPLRIEEEAIRHDQNEDVNVILRKQSTIVLKSDLNLKGNQMKRGPNKHKSTIQIVCYNCNKLRHLVKSCRNGTRFAAQVEPSRRGFSSYDY